MATNNPIKFPTRIRLNSTVKWEKSFAKPIKAQEEKAETEVTESEPEESAVSEDSDE